MNAPHDPRDMVTLTLPRSALTIVERPATVSQRTSERVLGIPRRAFLELARDFAAAGGEVLIVGKLRLVEVDALMRWLAERSRAASNVFPLRKAGAEGEAHDPVAALAAELGLVARSR